MKAAHHRKAVLPQTGSHHDLLLLESSFNMQGWVGQKQERDVLQPFLGLGQLEEFMDTLNEYLSWYNERLKSPSQWPFRVTQSP